MHCGPYPPQTCACSRSLFVSTAHQFTTRQAVPLPPVVRSPSLALSVLGRLEHGQVGHAFWKRTVAPDRPAEHVGHRPVRVLATVCNLAQRSGPTSPGGYVSVVGINCHVEDIGDFPAAADAEQIDFRIIGERPLVKGRWQGVVQ
jgi:hypothetical protein